MAKLRENPYFEVEQRLKNFERETDYTMTAFSDRVVEHPLRFKLVDRWNDGTDDYVQVAFSEGEVIEEGTDLSERNLGNVDVGVAILYEWRRWANATLLTLALKTDGLEMTTLNGMIANAFGVTFDLKAYNSNDFKVIKGYYDAKREEVWS